MAPRYAAKHTPLLGLLLVVALVQALCSGDWEIAFDADVEAYRGCRTAGSITISGGDVTSLAGLQSLESAGAVTISNNYKLVSLDGLEKLVHAGESVSDRLDTAMGTLLVAAPHDLYHQSWLVPVAFALPVLLMHRPAALAMAVALGGAVLQANMAAEGGLGAAAAVLVFTAATYREKGAERVAELGVASAEEMEELCRRAEAK